MRPLTPDDLLRREEVGEVALSPDGRWLAFVVRRPRLTASFHKYDFLAGGDRSDVWAVDTAGGEPRCMTTGAEDGWGYWAPDFSPGGSHLAMLSTRGGNVRLWVLELAAETLTCASERGVDLGFPDRSHLWISDERLLIATLPEGERPVRMTIEVQAGEAAMREWPKAWKGEEATASVLESGVHAPFGDRPQGELVIFDASSGERQTVLTGLFRDLRSSPDGSHVAFARQVDVVRPHPDRPLSRTTGEQRELGVVRTDGTVITAAMGIDQPLSSSLRWAPDGEELAVIGREPDATDSPVRAFRYRLADARLEPASPPSLEPVSLVWTTGDDLLAMAGPARSPTEQERTTRLDWWRLRIGEEPRNLTDAMESVPRTLIPEEGLASFVGVAAGDLFRVSVEDGGSTNMTAGFEGRIASIMWPAAAESSQAVGRLVLAVSREGSNAWHCLDLPSGDLRAVSKPAVDASILELAPEHDTAVLACADRTGNRLWLSRPAFQRNRAIVERNVWLAEVTEGEIRPIDYVGLDGDKLRGWLMLPVGYQEGRRCPLVVEVYPGMVFSREAPVPAWLSINGHHCLNHHLLAAHGFAVLFPSMPLKPEGVASDPSLELTNGVLPALDRAIELGVADPARLGLMGQSFGGYAAYALIAQTTRFRAAVALAGFANLSSLYGQFDARFRYDDHSHEHTLQATLLEVGQSRIGGAPWTNAAGYVRNSPLFHTERIDTPLLIIQGDMDYVALQQGEEMFAALYRQGKRARFARYWGEGHVLASPPNIRDMWKRIHGWFDEHLRPPAQT